MDGEATPGHLRVYIPESAEVSSRESGIATAPVSLANGHEFFPKSPRSTSFTADAKAELEHAYEFATEFANQLEVLCGRQETVVDRFELSPQRRPDSESFHALDLDQAIVRCQACISPIAASLQELESFKKNRSPTNGSPAVPTISPEPDLHLERKLQTLQEEADNAKVESARLRMQLEQAVAKLSRVTGKTFDVRTFAVDKPSSLVRRRINDWEEVMRRCIVLDEHMCFTKASSR